MMKQIFSILLSFILLASHMNLTMGTHFCGGEAVETKVLLGETHLGCEMMDLVEPCDGSEHSNQNQVRFNNVPCCQNDGQSIHLQYPHPEQYACMSFLHNPIRQINVWLRPEYVLLYLYSR